MMETRSAKLADGREESPKGGSIPRKARRPYQPLKESTPRAPSADPPVVSSIARLLAQPLDPQVWWDREQLADFCQRILSYQLRRAARGQQAPIAPGDTPPPGELRFINLKCGLSPRVRQTLDRLLLGDSEKQVALHLNLSPHTVHIYVKTLYRKLNVSTRSELLARFIPA